MANTKTIEIPIALTGAERVVQGFNGIVSSIENRAQALRGVGERLAGAFSGLNNVMGLVTGAVVVEGLKRSVKAFQEEEVAITRVAIALRRFGPAAAEAKAELIGQAEAMEAITGLSVEAVLGAQAMLLSTGASVETVKAMVPLIADLSAAMGSDMTSATRLIGAALDGETIRLGRFNIEAANAEELVQQLTRAVGGQAAAVNEARGSYLAFQVAWDDIEKLFGRVLTKPVTGFLTGVANGIHQIVAPLDEAIQGSDSLILRLTGGTEAVGRLVGKIAPYAVLTVAGLMAVNVGMKAVTVSTGILGGVFTLITGQSFVPLIGALQSLSAQAGLTAAVFHTGGAAANVFALGIAGIGVAIAGFQLGKLIGEVELFGDTISERITRGLLVAQQTWVMTMVTIREAMGTNMDEARKHVRELQTAIDETGGAYRRAQAEAEEKRRAENEARNAEREAARERGKGQAPKKADLDSERERAIMRGQTNLAVDKLTLERGRVLLEAEYESRKITLDEYLAWRAQQIGAAYEMDLADGLHKAQAEKDANKARVLEEEAEKIAQQRRLTSEQELELFRLEQNRVAAAAKREEEIQAIESESAQKREANAADQSRVESAFFLTSAQKREDLIKLDTEELGILDEQIEALKERLALETESAAQAQIRSQLGGAQQERTAVSRRRSGRQSEADPSSFRDQWDQTITALNERMNTLAQGVANTFSSVVQGAVDGIAGSIEGLIFATMSWGDALRNIGQSVVSALVGAIAKMFAEWILKMTLIRGLEAMFSVQRKTEIATELPLNVANSAAASGGSFGTSAILGLVAFAALMAAALSFGGAFAKGGRPKRGALNLVGEEGPELFVPDVSGTIIPADRTAAVLSGMGSGAPAGRSAGGTGPGRRGKEGSTMILVDDRAEAARHLRSAGGEVQVRNLVRGELVRLGIV